MTVPIHSLTADVRAFRRRLLDWYRRHRRDLPWRHRETDPYAQLVAELMLHQTQVATVIPYYRRFLNRFPDVHALAAAPREDVLAHWAGLGYYRRAHALHDAARMVVTDLGGVFPDEVDALMALPGIGRYTAGAIASIAFRRPAPVLDGNVRRVLCRLYADDGDDGRTVLDNRLWQRAAELIAPRSPGRFNQALMELGATVCLPKAPACDRCPVVRWCRAAAHGEPQRWPVVRPRTAPTLLDLGVVVCRTPRQVLLARQGRRGLWGGMWTLPYFEWTGRQGNGLHAARTAVPGVVSNRVTKWTRSGTVQHQLTHRSVRFTVLRGGGRVVRLPDGYRWAPVDDNLPLPRAFVKVLQSCGELSTA